MTPIEHAAIILESAGAKLVPPKRNPMGILYSYKGYRFDADWLSRELPEIVSKHLDVIVNNLNEANSDPKEWKPQES